MIILTSLYLLCSILYAIIGTAIFKNDYKNKLNRIFFIICIILSLWAFMVTMMNSTSSVEIATLFRVYATFFWGIFHCITLHFFIVLSSKEGLLKNPLSYLFLYLPGTITIYLYVFYQQVTVEEIVQVSLGWAFINIDRGLFYNHFYSVYALSYATIGILLLWNWAKTTNVKRERYQAKIIIISLLCVSGIGSVVDLLIPNLGIKFMPPVSIILLLIPVLGVWYSIKKYKLMCLNPQNVLLGVLRTMGEGMLVVNRNNVIIDTNEGAISLLGYSEDQLLNSNIDIILPKNQHFSLENDCSSLEIYLQNKDNIILPVLFSSSTLKDEWGDILGTVCIFQDISEIKNYQDKLKNAYDNLEKRVTERTSELKNANIELENEVIKRAMMEEEVRKLALTDHLTGLPNRVLFNDRLKKAIRNAQGDCYNLAVLFLDLDLFKMVNDTFGHSWGDELLKIVANRLSAILREIDTVARVGGDEFIILLESPVDENYVRRVAQDILDSIKQSFKFNSNEIFITVSIGIAMYPFDGKDSDTLIKNADIAMYKSKELGKNKYQFCDPLMKSTVYEEMKLTNYLYQALDRNELLLCYQPLINIYTGKIIGVEALIRWYHPEIGFISPKHFIPIAEKTGLIVTIGEWVLRTACLQKKDWLDKGILDVPVSINLSVNQFMNNKIVGQIENILKETGINPNDLDIEMTERIFMKDNSYIVKTLEELKKLGVTISIDDFGIEYSSLNYLKTLPIDKIKIAMEFVSGINKNPKDEAIISAMIILGKNLGLKVVAEGVERIEQVEFLKKHFCDSVQGYYYYRPMMADGLEDLLKSNKEYIVFDNKELSVVSNI